MEVREREQALSSDAARIFGFEALADWNVSGAAVVLDGNSTQGASALAIQPQGWTQLDSVPLSSLGEVGDEISLDLLVPQNVGWGDVQIVLVAPSLGMYYESLGSVALTTLVAGSYNTVSFALSSQLQAALAGSYTDLRLKVILNGPNVGVPYLIDNLQLTDEDVGEPPAPGLVLTGSSNFSLITDPTRSGFYFQEFDGLFHLSNQTGESATIDRALLLFRSPGDYSVVASHDIWWPTLSASATPVPAGTFAWGWSAPLTHLVLRLEGETASGRGLEVSSAIKITASDWAEPEEIDVDGDLFVGVIGPLQALELSNGSRWIDFSASVIDMTESSTEEPILTGRILDQAGHQVTTLSVSNNHPDDVGPAWRFRAWAEMPLGAEVAAIELTTTHPGHEEGTVTQVKEFPLLNTPAHTINSPVSGTWIWSNGPGHTNQWHAHAVSPEGHYGYDLGIEQNVNGFLRTFRGDPAVNENYFCWGQPILAVNDGTVIYVNDSFPSNNGNLQDVMGQNNEIVIEHPDGTFSRYAHMITGSATVNVGDMVSAGTQIALVGNAGASSEPHLHFHMFKIADTGHIQAIPTRVNGLMNVNGDPAPGVPASRAAWSTP